MIKYMKSFGFDVNNDAFEKHSWYFRNALVRANYNDFKKGVHATTTFLEQFFGNVLTEKSYELKNRYMHVDYVESTEENGVKPDNMPKSAEDMPKSAEDGMAVKLEGQQMQIYNLVLQNQSITTTDVQELLGVKDRRARQLLSDMCSKGFLKRVGATSNLKYVLNPINRT